MITTVQELTDYQADNSEDWYSSSFPVTMGTGASHFLLMKESIRQEFNDKYHNLLPGDTIVFKYARTNSGGALVMAELHVRQNTQMNAIPCVTQAKPEIPDLTDITVYEVEIIRSKFSLDQINKI